MIFVFQNQLKTIRSLIDNFTPATADELTKEFLQLKVYGWTYLNDVSFHLLSNLFRSSSERIVVTWTILGLSRYWMLSRRSEKRESTGKWESQTTKCWSIWVPSGRLHRFRQGRRRTGALRIVCAVMLPAGMSFFVRKNIQWLLLLK